MYPKNLTGSKPTREIREGKMSIKGGNGATGWGFRKIERENLKVCLFGGILGRMENL